MSEDDAKLLHTVERREFQNELAHRNTRQGAFEQSMLHLGHPLIPGGRELEASDLGTGAEAIRRHCEMDCDPQRHPTWVYEWRRAYAQLPPTAKAVLHALKNDWRTAPAARIAGVSRPTVDEWKNKFKKIFAQCLRAWKRDFGQK